MTQAERPPLPPRQRWGRPLTAGASVAVIVSLLPLAGPVWWGFDLFSHFRLQYLAIQALLVVLLAVCRLRILAAVVALSMLLNALPLAPYLRPASSIASGPSLSVLIANVWGDRGNARALRDVIRAEAPDLVLVLELRPALAAELEALHGDYPHRVLRPTAGFFGIGLYSRAPLQLGGHTMIGQTNAIDVLVDTEAGQVSLLGVHLFPPTSAEWARMRDEQLVEVAQETAAREGPGMVCGDFNLSPYSRIYRRFVAAGRLGDARIGQGLGISWPADLPLLGIPIDHCFVRGAIEVKAVRRLPAIGSDHYPQLFEFVLNGAP